MTGTFEDLLAHLDLALDPIKYPGLVATDPAGVLARVGDAAVHTAELIALERARHFGADYVYFRRPEGQSPVPVAWLFDRCGERARLADVKDEAALTDLHRRVWSAGDVPLVMLFRPDRVDVFHQYQGPGIRGDAPVADPWATVDLVGAAAVEVEVLHYLSSRRMDSGQLWEGHPRAARLNANGAAYMSLAEELDRTRKTLVDKHGIPKALVKRLLVLFVLVQYLDERRDAEDGGVFPPGTFDAHAAGASCFVDLLRAGSESVLSFLQALSAQDRLNGKVFALTPAEQAQLRAAPLQPIADLLEGRFEGPQRLMWRRYAFSELPVELISHIYEQFLPRQQGVVYTPPFIVTAMLDEVLPLAGPEDGALKILDPACGSGVFLVGAFKRLVQRWRRKHDLAHPPVSVLQDILRSSVFGYDKEPEAVQLTQFSLSVALCDFLQPRVIWEELHFEDLVGQTIHCADFFTHAAALEADGEGTFDCVVGNPPFVSELTDDARGFAGRLRDEDAAFSLPDQQIALLFLRAALCAVRLGGRVALIQPAGALLYNAGSEQFRSALLNTATVPLLVDLTMLARVLFRRPGGNRGDTAVVLAFAERRPPQGEPTLHIAVRRTEVSDLKLRLEIDPYDCHLVPLEDARSDPRVWKANLIGGGRLPALIQRLSGLPTLGQHLKRMEAERGWVSGEGFKDGAESKALRAAELDETAEARALTAEERSERRRLRRFRRGGWLTGRRPVDTSAFTSSGARPPPLERKALEMTHFAWTGRKELYEPPVLLIKEVVEEKTGRIPTFLSRESIVFNSRIFGVHATEADRESLAQIQERIRTPLSSFLAIAHSSEFGVTKSTSLLARDIMRLPAPDAPVALSEADQLLIDDVLLEVPGLLRKGPDAPCYHVVSMNDLTEFGRWFVRVLGSVYPQVSAGAPQRLSDAVLFPFWFGEPPAEVAPITQASLDALLRGQLGSAVSTRRVLRLFHENSLLLVKPPQRRYWLRSIAIRDADEVFTHLQAQGY